MTSRSNILDQPEIMPLPHEDWAGSSSLSISIVEGPTLNLWSIATATEDKTKNELTLHLQPDQSVVIGRQEGGRIEYLDPRYQPTQMLPNSNKRVVTSFNRGSDRSVSRGHFMLRGSVHGILFVNGVPRRGGGIRPPKNGTQMLAPCHRNQKMTKELPDTEETHANSYAMPAVPAGDEIVVGRSVLCLACRNVFLFTIEAPAPLDQFANLFERLMLHNGAHLRAGRQQFRWLRESGFSRIEASASYDCWTRTPEETCQHAAFLARMVRDSSFSAQLLAAGITDRATLELMSHRFDEWGRNPDAFAAEAWGEAVAWQS